MTVEKAPYEVVQSDGRFELRSYPPQIVAEIVVDGTLKEAGGRAFRPLFDYISGENRSRGKIAMTAPVAQRAVSEKIAMTAPVGQRPAPSGGWAVSFMMPAEYSMETLPEPSNPDVALREIPARRMAVVRYSGFWSEARYCERLEDLQGWMRQRNLEARGEPVWARYNPPFTPWFLRRNEILIPVDAEDFESDGT